MASGVVQFLNGKIRRIYPIMLPVQDAHGMENTRMVDSQDGCMDGTGNGRTPAKDERFTRTVTREVHRTCLPQGNGLAKKSASALFFVGRVPAPNPSGYRYKSAGWPICTAEPPIG